MDQEEVMIIYKIYTCASVGNQQEKLIKIKDEVIYDK